MFIIWSCFLINDTFKYSIILYYTMKRTPFKCKECGKITTTTNEKVLESELCFECRIGKGKLNKEKD